MKRMAFWVSLALVCALLAGCGDVYAGRENILQAYNGLASAYETAQPLTSWQVLALRQEGKLTPEQARAYRDSFEPRDAVAVLAYAACGGDVADHGGADAAAPFAAPSLKGDAAGTAWSIILLSGTGHAQADGSVQEWMRQLLFLQQADGSWAQDAFTTALAMQALSPACNSDKDVQLAVNRGIAYLSSVQREDGGFSADPQENAAACAMTAVALGSLIIDPEEESRLLKNGNSPLDALAAQWESGQLTGEAGAVAYAAFANYHACRTGGPTLFDVKGK